MNVDSRVGMSQGERIGFYAHDRDSWICESIVLVVWDRN